MTRQAPPGELRLGEVPPVEPSASVPSAARRSPWRTVGLIVAFLAGVAWLSLYGLVAVLRSFATFSIGY